MKNIFRKWQVFEIPYEIRADGWYTLQNPIFINFDKMNFATIQDVHTKFRLHQAVVRLTNVFDF